MNIKQLRKLLKVREHRVDVARAALEAKRRIVDACKAECERLQKRLEETLLKRLSEQRDFNEHLGAQASAALTIADAQYSENYVGRLTDVATSIGQEIVAARKALAKAEEEAVAARRALRHAMAKHDALVNVMDKALAEERQLALRSEEEETEEIASRRVALI
ncbi:MAG: hypothetical protein AB8G16_14370 [Gammaproteobacteria bacterium]